MYILCKDVYIQGIVRRDILTHCVALQNAYVDGRDQFIASRVGLGPGNAWATILCGDVYTAAPPLGRNELVPTLSFIFCFIASLRLGRDKSGLYENR
jgi:hypothetical protein